MQNFTGRLDTSADVAEGSFRVKLFFKDDTLEVVTFDADSWSWDMSEVLITRIRADRFQLELGAETLFFLPDDPLAFTLKLNERAEAGHPTDRQPTPKRGWLRRRIEEAATVAGPEQTPAYEPDQELVDATPGVKSRFGRRTNHTHIWEKTISAGVARRRCADCGHVSIDLTGVTSVFDRSHPHESRADQSVGV